MAVSGGSTVMSILRTRQREKPCLHEASKEQFGFPDRGVGAADSHIKMTGELVVILKG